MPSVFQQNLNIYLRPSRFMMGFLLLTHLGGIMLILALPLQWWAQLLITFIVLVSLIHSIKKQVYYKTSKAIRQLHTNEGQIWYLQQQGGEELIATLLGDSVVTLSLIILNFKLQNRGRRTVLIFKDAVAANLFRQLRVLVLAQRKL